MTEIWKNHPIYSHYEVSTLGNVRSIAKLKNRKMRFDRDGYLRLNLSFAGKIISVSVHRLVAETFLEKASPDLTVNHINHDKTDNSLKNLEYVTMRENHLHCFRAGRSKACKPVTLSGSWYYSKREAERCTGVPRQSL